MSGGRRAPQLSNPEEISIWNKLIQMQGTVFYTSGRGNRPGVQFTYTIRGAELFASTKEKSITRASIISAYWKAKELDGFVSGPKKLGVFGARGEIERKSQVLFRRKQKRIKRLTFSQGERGREPYSPLLFSFTMFILAYLCILTTIRLPMNCLKSGQITKTPSDYKQNIYNTTALPIN